MRPGVGPSGRWRHQDDLGGLFCAHKMSWSACKTQWVKTLARFWGWKTSQLMRVQPQSFWPPTYRAFFWAHWFPHALGRMMTHRSSLGARMHASDINVHVNLLQHYDQASRTHCVMALVPFQPVLSPTTPVVLRTLVGGPIQFRCEVWMVQLWCAFFCCSV